MFALATPSGNLAAGTHLLAVSVKHDLQDYRWMIRWTVLTVIGKFFQKLRVFDVDINGGTEKAEAKPRLSQFMATLSLAIP